MSSSTIIFFITICSLTQIGGLKCFKCNSTTDIKGTKTGCRDEILMQKYLIDCAPAAVSTAKAGTTKPPAKPSTTTLPGIYCYTKLSFSYGKLVLTRGCGQWQLKSSTDVHTSCADLSDKYSASTDPSQPRICYCGLQDGCNGFAHIEHHEDDYLQHLNASGHHESDEESSHEHHRHHSPSSKAAKNSNFSIATVFVMILISWSVYMNL